MVSSYLPAGISVSRVHPYRFSLALGALVYGVGVIGMLTPWREWFVGLTPFSLLLSYTLLWWNQPLKGRDERAFLMAAFALGFGVEVLGVNTGFPFGSYLYGPALGPKLWATPLLIGVNWTLLVFCANDLARRVFAREKTGWKCVLLGAALPPLLDVLIEPVAVRLGYWTWAGGGLPGWENYAGWTAVSLLLSLAYRRWVGPAGNPLAPWLFVFQVAFFGLLGVFLGE